MQTPVTVAVSWGIWAQKNEGVEIEMEEIFVTTLCRNVVGELLQRTSKMRRRAQHIDFPDPDCGRKPKRIPALHFKTWEERTAVPETANEVTPV